MGKAQCPQLREMNKRRHGCPPVYGKQIMGDKGRKPHEPQTNGHSPWSGDEGDSIEERAVGGDSLEKVRCYQKLSVDLGEAKEPFN